MSVKVPQYKPMGLRERKGGINNEFLVVRDGRAKAGVTYRKIKGGIL